MPILNENTVLLVSGGARGITAQCAIKIAETVPCRFILAGRSSILEAEPAWANGIAGDKELQDSALKFFLDHGEKVTPKILQKEIKDIQSSREIQSTLHEIEKCGGKAVYISADVTNPDSLFPQVQSAVEKFGAVTGIIHGAGALADKLIENKSSQDFDLVVNTKIEGLRNIIKAVDPDSLKFLVLFSSVAGVFGNIGQSDYAIANEILNKMAHKLQKSLPNCRVIAIDWGPWDSGMVSEKMKKVFAVRNIQLISTKSGAEALVNELTVKKESSAQIMIGSPIHSDIEFKSFSNPEIVIHRQLDLKNNLFLNDHRIGPQPVLPATCAASWLADACEALHPGFSLRSMDDFKVLKGITFGEGEHEYTLELKLLPEAPAGQKVYETAVTSWNGNERKIFHYTGQVTLAKEIPVPPKHPSVRELMLDVYKARKGSEFYQDGTLFHGPLFQGIQDVFLVNECSVITRVELPEMDTQLQGQFPARTTNPFITDAIVQSLLIWTQSFNDAPCLPSRLHHWDQYRMIPFGVPAWAILTVTFHNDYAVTADILVQDEDGNEYFQFKGLEGTISKNLKRFIGKKSI